jgi:uncharacterized protein YjiS (DUF1127 family)
MTRHFAARAFAQPSPAARRTGFARSWWRTYWDWRARKTTILLLHALDRRTLRDIGIDPSEIESLVTGGGDRCRRYDPAWPWRSDGA